VTTVEGDDDHSVGVQTAGPVSVDMGAGNDVVHERATVNNGR
jgi:hypothetical protein